MLDSLFTKQSRVRQPSVVTGSSADTMSTITTAVVKKNNKFKGNKQDECGGIGDTHSHHSQSSADDESSLVSVKSGISRCCKQGSSALRKWQMFQMIFLPFIPITALIIQNSTLLSSVLINLQETSEMKQQINTIVMIGKLLTELQQERAEFGFCIFTNSPETTLSVRFDRTEKVVHNLSTYVANYVPTVATLRDKREKIFELTAKNDSADDIALDELLWYNLANDVILDLLSNQIRKTTTSGVWKVLIAYKNVIRCIENYSVSMVYGLYYFGKGRLSQNSYNRYIQFDSLAADYLNATKSFSPEVTVLWDRLIGHNWKHGFDKLTERRATIYRNDRIEGSDSEAKVYYANMTTYIDELRKFQRHLSVMIDNQVMDEMIAAKVKKVVAATLLVLVMLISPIIIFLVRNVTVTIQSYSMVLSSKTADLKREKRKSDRLLQQMLPAEVIRQLRARKQVPAESFDSVTIYFSDIVSFTNISASSSPMEIVVMLNSLYKMFDSRIENYDVYKVETIGDAYMVVSGLPLRNGILHAGEICTMALDLIAGVRNFEIPHRPGLGLQIRVGINTGACVAGVVGTKMPRYCLFGDAINVASRMESHGEPMRIHVTESTKKLLDELGGYVTEERGTLEIKGKGVMNTFWLTEKIGGVPRSLEMVTPGFFASSPSDSHSPEFLRELFGKGESEEERPDFEAVQLNVKKLASQLQDASHNSSSQQNPSHVSASQRNSTTYVHTSRFQGCSPS